MFSSHGAESRVIISGWAGTFSTLTLIEIENVSTVPVGSSLLGDSDPQDDKTPECLYQASPETEH